MAIRDSKIEAEFLIDFAKEEQIQQDDILAMLMDMLSPHNNINFKSKQWSWKIAEFIQDTTSYIVVDQNVDVDFEKDGYGRSIIVGAGGPAVGITINDKEGLINLTVEIDNFLNKTEEKIHYFLKKGTPKWKCQCGRYLGAELSSFDEVKKFLKNFMIGKLRKCRSCKRLNSFEILNNGGISFLGVDTYSK